MSSTVRGFNIRDITPPGYSQLSNVVVNPAQVLPATASANLFTVTGVVLVTALFGIVTTVFSATAVHIELGDSQNPSAIAAKPAAALSDTGVGNVLVMPASLGADLPVPVDAAGEQSACSMFVVDSADITITTDATNTGAITWLLSYVPLYPGRAGSVVAG
jgi:hypothetical protein